MSLNHLHSAYLILAILAAVIAVGVLLYLFGIIDWVLDLFANVVKGAVTAGFHVWESLLSWGDWRAVGALVVGTLLLGFLAHWVEADLFAVFLAVLLLALGLVTCLAYMYLSFERYEVARGYKAIHSPLMGQALAADLARYGEKVGAMLLVVSAIGTILGFAQLNYALYESFGESWYRFKNPDERAVFLDFLTYTLLNLLRVVDVLDLAAVYTEVTMNIILPAYWPARVMLIGFKSFFTLLLLQQVFASVRDGRLLAETVTDFWSPHAPIHERARSALPQFGPSALRAIIDSLQSLGPLTKEQRDQIPVIIGTMGPVAIPELLRHAGSEHEPTRGIVAKSLGTLGTPDAVAALIGLSADPSEAVRAAAVEGIGTVAGHIGRSKTRPVGELKSCRGRWRVARLLRGMRLPNRFTSMAEPVPQLRHAELVPACVAALRKALKDDSALVRSDAVTALGKIGEPAVAAAMELASVLGTDSDEVQKRAAISLGQVRAEAALIVPSLLAALQHANPEVRAAAANSLGEFGPAAADAVSTLVLLLQDREEAVRKAAAQAVKRIGVVCEASTQLLVDGLASSDNVVRAQTAEALGVIGDKAEAAAAGLVHALKDQNDAVRGKAAEALGKMGEGVADLAVPGLVRLLRDEDNWVRAIAAEALGQMGEAAEDAAPALLKSLVHPNPVVRANAADALGKLKSERARTALESACRDEDPSVRARALGAIEELGPAPSSTVVVIECLIDPDPQVRATAVDTIGNWPGIIVAPEVFRGLIDDANDEVAARAIRFAPQLSTVDAVLPALRGRLHSPPNPMVQTAAALALGKLGPPAADAEPELAVAAREGDSELRLAAMRALAQIQSPGAAGVFATGLLDPDAQVRKLASAGLMMVTALPDEAIPAVVDSLRDPDEQVRANAAHLLSLLDPVPAQAIPDLIEAVQTGGDGLRLNAATALRHVESATARDALRGLLADPNARVRLVAAGSLAAETPDDPDVRAALAASLQDSNPKVQASAAELIQTLGLNMAEPLPVT